MIFTFAVPTINFHPNMFPHSGTAVAAALLREFHCTGKKMSVRHFDWSGSAPGSVM